MAIRHLWGTQNSYDSSIRYEAKHHFLKDEILKLTE